MTSKIIVTHEADAVGPLFDGLQMLLPLNMPAGAHMVAQVQITIPSLEKPVATEPAAPPSAESAPSPSLVQGAPVPSSPAPSSEAPAAPKKRGRPKKVEAPNADPVGDAQASLPLPDNSGAPIVPPAEPKAALTKDDARNALHDLVTRRSLELGAGVLSRFGARKLSDLHAGDYERFIADCKTAAETGVA